MLKINKNLFLAMLALGVMFILASPETMAQTRCRTRGNDSRSVYDSRDYRDRDYRDANYRDRNYRNTSYRDNQNYDYSYNDYGYRDREDTTGKALKRTGIGAGIGAVSGAVIGGKKGALIGAGIGAAGGYIYHREKVKNDRYRY
ncbi:MAG TPA: YMGG-like glycine zipper-containing protein [Blastocatellia bacterium]|nr:YMGG-like glycine zipper-containing protein [Blastocatellia bacterium]